MCGQKGHLTRMCKQQNACVGTVGVAIKAAFCSNIKVAINGKIESKSINTAVDITIVNKETWRQIGIPDCKAADDLVISAHGDDWKLTIRVSARISYCGNGAAGDVQITHDYRNILSKNFVLLLKLVKVQVLETSGRIVKASAPAANPDGKDHTEQKVIAQHDFSEETWREFKESQCATKNCTRPRSARPEIIRSHSEDFSAEISSSFIIRSSFGEHEANPNGQDHTEEKVIGKDHTVEKVITEVECVTEGFRDHKAPAVIENVIVKVECEEGSARDHNALKAKVKVRGHETNDSGYTEIFLQDRYSDIVRVAPENTAVGKSSRVEK
ncbi:hypothetical protein PRIPAC_97728 [Pristionchus pacificus]|uniref:Uncharacterized protein n=1 Tax=Pristionchus pacificus TaxID=54126 RepID=A0A2A6B2J6_PRIPA|nr:hypothetical protein PRIPAC_97728 [Pristionchus pacificus]|eukprot:PDM60094.1 hypothetical protein PRIPAC_49380 [Pristionchus pacificus]